MILHSMGGIENLPQILRRLRREPDGAALLLTLGYVNALGDFAPLREADIERLAPGEVWVVQILPYADFGIDSIWTSEDQARARISALQAAHPHELIVVATIRLDERGTKNECGIV